jgi:hypothetical protein
MLLPMKPKSSSNLGKLMRANGIFKAESRFRSSGTPAYRRRSEVAFRVKCSFSLILWIFRPSRLPCESPSGGSTSVSPCESPSGGSTSGPKSSNPSAMDTQPQFKSVRRGFKSSAAV